MSHKRHIYLTEDTDRKLQELAEKEGLNASAWMRRVILFLHAKQFGNHKSREDDNAES
jgi:Ribbon-helix-helix protein, copG family